MYRMAWTMMVVVFLAGVSTAQQNASEIPWFDMQQCAFCKNMAPLEDRMAEIACDTHKIENGMMMVSFVPADLKDAVRESNEAMMDTVKELESGKQLPMCGFCQQIGMFLSKGVKMQKYTGAHGEVTLFTTDDPTLVKSLHEFADRTIEESAAHLKRIAQSH